MMNSVIATRIVAIAIGVTVSWSTLHAQTAPAYPVGPLQHVPPVQSPPSGYPATAPATAPPYPTAAPYPAQAPYPAPYPAQAPYPSPYPPPYPGGPPPYQYAQGNSYYGTNPAARRLPYEDGQPIPPGYHIENRVRMGAVIAGSIMVGAAYLPLLYVTALVNFRENTSWWAVPLIGPWVGAAQVPRNDCTPSAIDYCDNSANDFGRFILIVDGLVQGAGAVLAIWGMSGRKMLIRDDFAYFVVTPGPLGPTGYGAIMFGRF